MPSPVYMRAMVDQLAAAYGGDRQRAKSALYAALYGASGAAIQNAILYGRDFVYDGIHINPSEAFSARPQQEPEVTDNNAPEDFDLTRLIKLMGMTGSQQDGEALSALRMANKEIGKLNTTWEDLLRGKVRVLVNPFAGGPPPATPTDTHKANAPRPAPPPNWGRHTPPPPPRPQAPPRPAPSYRPPRPTPQPQPQPKSNPPRHSHGGNVSVTLTMHVHGETKKAFHLSTTGKAADARWTPKSQISTRDIPGTTALSITMPEWLAYDKGFVKTQSINDLV